MREFEINMEQSLHAGDERELLDGLEAALEFRIQSGNVFAIFGTSSGVCQMALKPNNDMLIESDHGNASREAGFTSELADWPDHFAAALPAAWHSRARMVAGAMIRAFVDLGQIEFPAMISVGI